MNTVDKAIAALNVLDGINRKRECPKNMRECIRMGSCIPPHRYSTEEQISLCEAGKSINKEAKRLAAMLAGLCDED
jgi:hypothetical protein